MKGTTKNLQDAPQISEQQKCGNHLVSSSCGNLFLELEMLVNVRKSSFGIAVHLPECWKMEG